MSDNTLTQHANGSVTLSAGRQMVCLEAVCELEALAAILHDLVPNTSESGHAHYAVRCLSDRIRRLSCTVMSALNDDIHPLADLRRNVFGATHPKKNQSDR